MKRGTIITFILSSFLGVCNAFADDVNLNITETGTKKPVEGANIFWQLLQNTDKEGFGISDENGELKINIPIGEKAIITASCIGYKTAIDTILIGKSNHIYLKEDILNLDQVVVLGYSKPTTVDSSLYTVRVIDKDRITSSGATNLSELFLTEPNIKLGTDLILGTNVEMLGLSGSNVKIMIDGVPVIGRLNGQIDLSQITMDNVDHIEIIEGPMSVIYGNNALAGTINIITHRNKYFNTEINVNAGFEDVKKYESAINLSQKLGKSNFNLSGNYSDFQGVDFDKSDRSLEWKPKRQYTINAGYILNFKNWDIDTRASYYNSRVTVKSDIQNYKVYDSHYFTDRYSGSANLQGKWNSNNHLNILTSYSYYNRKSQDESKDLTTLESIKGEKISSQKQYNSLLRAVWHHDFSTSNPLSIENGIDFNFSAMEGGRIKDEKQHINDYAFFTNLRYSPWDNFEVQPGLRHAYNTDYNVPLVYSFNTKWNIAPNLSWKVSVAKGFRAPTVKELYYVFIDSNHEIYGNDQLKAEKSNNFSSSLEYNYSKQNNKFKAKLQLYYNDVDNLISLIQKQDGRGYQYNNIEKYKTKGGNLDFTYFYKNWLRINTSCILTARYNKLSDFSDTKDFNTTFDWIAGLQIKEPYSKITLNTDFKLYGKENYFYYNSNLDIQEGEQDSYEILNVSLNRNFWNNRLKITLGAKNLTNVKDVVLSGASGGGHGSANKLAISYGRSFFVKASFRITN